MSNPNPIAEWHDYAHDLVEEYCESCGQTDDAPYYYEMLKDKTKREGWMWECFEEYVNESIDNQ